MLLFKALLTIVQKDNYILDEVYDRHPICYYLHRPSSRRKIDPPVLFRETNADKNLIVRSIKVGDLYHFEGNGNRT
jgi:hypothetical protein